MVVILQMDKINSIYRKLIEQIKLDGEDYTDNEMKSVYKDQKSKLDELHTFIGLLFIKYATDGLLNLNITQKANVTNEINDFLKNIAKDLGQNEIDKVTDILSKVYQDTYYKNAYVMDLGMDINLKFNILKKEFIDAAVNQKFKGELFSSRVWSNKADMIDKFKKSIIDCMQGNTTIDKIGKDIQNTFNAQAYQSKRLVQTEMARVQSQASDDIAHNTGVKQQMYSATLDNKTSEECAANDGKIWDIDDPDKIVPPENHPNCRCVLINMPSEDWKPTMSKDNETKEIIDYKDYASWLKDKNIDD